MTASPLQSLYKKLHPELWVHLLHFMSEPLGYMPHLSTLMLTINLVNIYFLLPIVETFGPEVRIRRFLWLHHALGTNICYLNVNLWTSDKMNPTGVPLFLISLCIFLLLIVKSGVEAGKKAAGEVLALQKRVLSVLNEAR